MLNPEREIEDEQDDRDEDDTIIEETDPYQDLGDPGA